MPRTVEEIREELDRLRAKCHSLYEEHTQAVAEAESLIEELKVALNHRTQKKAA